MSDTLAQKIEAMKAALRTRERVMVALSGGVDSSVCMALAHEALGAQGALAVTAKSETLTEKEFVEICEMARKRGWNHRTIEYSELDIPNYAENPVNRCFFCKHELYGRLKDLAAEWGCNAVIEGTNLDDRGDYRPGMQAASQQGTWPMLLEHGVSKAEVREIATLFGLPNWDKPSGACLSSRFPYGTTITREGLDKVSRSEEFLAEKGFRQVRVRIHDNLARIEVPALDIAALTAEPLVTEVREKLKEIGFTYVTVDMQGYRTGSMNEVLKQTAAH